MTPETLALVAGVILSLAFSYIPNLRTWFAEKTKEFQQLAMLGMMILVALSTYGLACAGVLSDLFGLEMTCDKIGILGLVKALIFAIMANQGMYKLTPQMADVQLAKAERDGAADLSLGKG
jgi:putative flippase GtrA